MKKLLHIFFLLLFTFSFAQQSDENNKVVSKNKPETTIISNSAYPNPFLSSTKINFSSTKSQYIEFSVKNLLGKTIYLEDIKAEKGINIIPFNRNNLRKGMYIYSLQTSNEIVSKRLIIK